MRRDEIAPSAGCHALVFVGMSANPVIRGKSPLTDSWPRRRGHATQPCSPRGVDGTMPRGLRKMGIWVALAPPVFRRVALAPPVFRSTVGTARVPTADRGSQRVGTLAEPVPPDR